MYADSDHRERLRNGLAWVEYRSFQQNGYDALLYGVEFGSDYEMDIARLDFDNEVIDLTWCYTSIEEMEEVREADRVFSDILDDNYLQDEDSDEWIRSNFVEDDEVTFITMRDAPEIRGEVMVRHNGVYEELESFSQGLFEPPLSSERTHPVIWAEGENIFD